MKTIQSTFKKLGDTFETINRFGSIIIFKRSRLGVCRGYEVHKIRIRAERVLNNRIIEGGEYLASNEDFGKYDWYYAPESENLAISKFEELVDKRAIM